jgi:serine protease Do
VNGVQSGSPAEKAGVRRGDVITAVNGETVKGYNDLRNEVSQILPGSSVKLTLVRDGKEQVVTATLAELKASKDADANRDAESPGDATGFGMSVEPLTREQARQLGVSATSGVLITDVQPSGRAADAGLRQGDVIVEVDRQPVASPDALRAALKTGSRPALLLVQRGAASMFVTLER